MRAEIDCVSMKALLKQVYAVHSAKLKNIEDENENLRKNLHEAENKLKNYNSECKRCVELEEAFNSCKSALHEQSKWFENLGQKFSTTNAPEYEAGADVKAPRIVNSTDNSSCPDSHEKLNFASTAKTHLLKNLISLESQKSLDLSCAPFEKKFNSDCSSLVVDSLVLAPNTVDVTSDVQEKNENTHVTNSNVILCIYPDAHKKQNNLDLKDICRKSTRKELLKKRLSNEHSDFTMEKHNEENEIKTICTNKKFKTSDKHIDYAIETPLTEQRTNNIIGLKSKKCKSPVDTSSNTVRKSVNTLALNVKRSKTIHISKTNLSTDKSLGKDDSCHVNVSPSLITLNEKYNANTSADVPEDINDFQIASANKTSTNEEGSWTSCDKKKLNKKVSNIKPLKTTSRFKMQLDVLPHNFKKPTYRQTKLSKSIFQPKLLNKCSEENPNELEINYPSATTSKTIDFDATCIPENYEYEVISTNKISSGKSNVSNYYNKIEGDLTDESDEENSSDLIIEQPVIKKKDVSMDDGVTIKNQLACEIGNSFDRLPKKEEPNYKYKEETVRKKAERKQLTGFDCNECEKYYSELGLSDEEKQKRMNKCSRHRSKFAPPPTPEHFWELDFPDTQECKARDPKYWGRGTHAWQHS